MIIIIICIYIYIFIRIYIYILKGIYNGIKGEVTAIKTITQSKYRNCLFAGGGTATSGYIKLFQYPSLSNSIPIIINGFNSHVLELVFTMDDEYLISIGGSSNCIFIWKISDILN